MLPPVATADASRPTPAGLFYRGRMGIFDKAKQVLGEHTDQADSAIDQAADTADERTGGQHRQHIDQGSVAAKDKLGDYLDQDAPPPA